MTLLSIRNGLALAVVAALSALSAPDASALTCGQKYTVRDGDTMNTIANEAYGIANKWTLIFYANQKQFGNETDSRSGQAAQYSVPQGS